MIFYYRYIAGTAGQAGPGKRRTPADREARRQGSDSGDRIGCRPAEAALQTREQRADIRGKSMLNFRIDTFLCVCRNMNFTHAAEELNITQPAVSQHIHYLEKEYGTKLFLQNGKKLELTESGKILFRKMNQMKNDEERLKRELSSSASYRKVSFGVTMTIGEYVISGPVSHYIQGHPDTDFVIHFGNTAELLRDLRDGVIDFALVEGYYPEDVYEKILYRSEKFIPVCASSHTFRTKPEKLSDLFSERLLVREPGSGTRSILERFLAAENHGTDSFSHYIQVENMHTIIQFLCRDCGISFLYKAAVEEELNQGILKEIPLKDFSIVHDFTFLWPKGSVFSDEIKEACESIIRAGR